MSDEFRKYTCHKIVSAKPMTNHEWQWERARGKENIASQNDGVALNLLDGYLVIYSNGYKSWSPKKAFDEGYTVVSDE